MNEQKGVFRLTITMFLLLGLFGLFGLVADAQKTQQQVDRLIKQLQDQNEVVRIVAALTLEKDRNTRSIRSNQELRQVKHSP